MTKIKILPFLLILLSQLVFAYNILNAKVGSTLISNWSGVGHAGIVVNEYMDIEVPRFIIASHGGGVRYDSYSTHLCDENFDCDSHLGHFYSLRSSRECEIINPSTLRQAQSLG